MKFVWPLLALGFVGLTASGLMVVDSDEVAVVYRLGAVDRSVGAGLGIRLPWPLEQDERVEVSTVRRAELPERRLLTGDTNLIDLALVAQYSVADPVAFSVSLADPERAVADEVAAVATEMVATLEVDVLLTTGRGALETGVRTAAQARLDALGAGVALASVEVAKLAPPPAVVDAFNDVSSARGDRETLALSAEGYASEVVPDARGEASRLVEQATGQASQLTARAQGDAARFLELAEQDRRATRLQLWSSAVAEVGAAAEVRVARPGVEVILGSDR